MNRRRFLSFFGFAPLIAAAPAVALPKPDKPTDIDKITVKLSIDGSDMCKMLEEIASDQAKMLQSELTQPLIFQDGKLWINPANISPLPDA